MAQQDLLTYAIRTLDAAGIEYMVTGSIVSSLQGEPRSTHGVDLIIAIQPHHIDAILDAFARPRFYVDQGGIQEAMQRVAYSTSSTPKRATRSTSGC